MKSSAWKKSCSPTNKIGVATALLCLTLANCSPRVWDSPNLESYRPSGTLPAAATCKECHESEYNTWSKTLHSNKNHMAPVPLQELHECAACHQNITEQHAADPAKSLPSNPAKLDKTKQNEICGKCHFNQKILGKKAINPKDRHAVFMDVGFADRKKQIACLDCHSGHKGKSEMLKNIKAHVCFTCHKEAIVTMGIFQPLNYLMFGKTCQACHAIHGGSTASQSIRMGVGFCVVCHFVGVALSN